ncbi:MAG: AbrB/MazE/SpoVT family DNA-binding domain-containing protein [Acidimicrobiales bacterium]
MTLTRSRVSSNGQVSIPASVRRRWQSSEVLVIDKGDRLIVRPVPADPVAAIVGKYASSPSSDEMRAGSRDEDGERDERHA